MNELIDKAASKEYLRWYFGIVIIVGIFPGINLNT